ncbi:MAG: ATP-binding protein [Bryobacteraceae bacterium]
MDESWHCGYQTIIFGREILDLERVFDAIHEAGFQGVELAQPPATLPPYSELKHLLGRKGKELMLLGLAGGSLQDRMQYLSDAGEGESGTSRASSPDALPYLYIEYWDDAIAPAAAKEHRLALHPHVFKSPDSLDLAFKVLWDHKELLWLPDTAHVRIAGESPVRAVHRHHDRMIGVHLKDWSPRFGRWSHRYARGFVDLGSGTVPLDEVIDELVNATWNRRLPGLPVRPWLIVELDSTPKDPFESIRNGAEWLAEKGFMPKPPQRATVSVSVGPTRQPRPKLADAERHYEFRRTLEEAASHEPDRFYARLISAFAELVGAKVAMLAALSPVHRLLGSLACHPVHALRVEDAQLGELLARPAIETQAAMVHDLRDPDPGEKFGFPHLRTALQDVWRDYNAPYLIVLPVFNTFNANHVRFVLQLLQETEPAPKELRDLDRVGEEIAQVADAWLNDLCLTAAAEVNVIAEPAESSTKFLEGIVQRLIPAEAVRCEGCSIFLADVAGKRLDLAATTGVEWNADLIPSERYYPAGVGLTGRVLIDKRPRLAQHAMNQPDWKGRSVETNTTSGPLDVDSILLAPISDQAGKLLGVLRCINKLDSSGSPTHFSDDDLAIVDAIFQAAVPHLLRLMEAEYRMAAIESLKHEFKGPLVGIRGNLDRMGTSVARLVPTHPEVRLDFLHDALAWSELLADMVEHLGSADPALQLAETRIFADVLRPVVRQVGILAKIRHFSRDGITVEEYYTFPPLWIDRMRFHQIFFNLLDNAIKYAKRDPNNFKVVIRCEADGGDFKILVQDYGLGIEKGWEEVIFHRGVRAPVAKKMVAAGQGIGLWVVRGIVEAHGGAIKVSRPAEPTEFTIVLPNQLRRKETASGVTGLIRL